MTKDKERRAGPNLLALTGSATLLVVAGLAANFIVSSINARRSKKKRRHGLPGSTLRINLSASEISKLADYIISQSQRTYDLVASVPIEKVTYLNVVAPLAELEAKQFPLVQSCIFPKMVSTSDDIRRACALAEDKLDSHFLMCRKREDVYHVIKEFVGRGERLGDEAKRYVNYLVKDFERNGANLLSSKKIEMDKLKSQIHELSLRYIENLNGDGSFILFSEAELDGMPPEFIKFLEKDEVGKLKVPLKSLNVSAILEQCKVGATRRFVVIENGKRCGKENLEVLGKLVQLRHKLARLLGYSNFADFSVELRMAKTSAKVFEFLEEISEKLNGVATKDLNLLKDLKMREEGNSLFGSEDLLYYMRKAEDELFELDNSQVKQYFPLGVVLSGIFRILQDLFGLKFEEIEDVEVWHEAVRVFSISNFSSSELLGYFYLDIFARAGKYAHTCVLPLQNGCLSSDSSRQIPVALLISQFQNQIDGSPDLLRFSDVVSLLHEFCHVVHHICSRSSFSRFSGLRLEADFCEIPSRLLENWCYECVSLKMMSGCYQDITKSIPSEICNNLKRRRDMFAGLKLKQEILIGFMDQFVHSSETVDILNLLRLLYSKVLLGIPLLEGTDPASCLPRLAIGYEGTCYSYIWSEAFAADIFATNFQDDLLNQYAGLEFRNKVLVLGGSKDAQDILSDYLGRQPSTRSFIESKIRNSWNL